MEKTKNRILIAAITLLVLLVMCAVPILAEEITGTEWTAWDGTEAATETKAAYDSSYVYDTYYPGTSNNYYPYETGYDTGYYPYETGYETAEPDVDYGRLYIKGNTKITYQEGRSYTLLVYAENVEISSCSVRMILPDFISVESVTAGQALYNLIATGWANDIVYGVDGNVLSVGYSGSENVYNGEFFKIEFTINERGNRSGNICFLDSQFVNADAKEVWPDMQERYINVTDTLVMGDIDLDGVVELEDVMFILNHVVRNDYLNDTQRAAADINHDGNVDMIDAQYIQNYLVNRIDSLDNIFGPEEEKPYVVYTLTYSTGNVDYFYSDHTVSGMDVGTWYEEGDYIILKYSNGSTSRLVVVGDGELYFEPTPEKYIKFIYVDMMSGGEYLFYGDTTVEGPMKGTWCYDEEIIVFKMDSGEEKRFEICGKNEEGYALITPCWNGVCSHPNTEVIDFEAYCGGYGAVSYYCPDCDYVYSALDASPLGHKYENGVCVRCDYESTTSKDEVYAEYIFFIGYRMYLLNSNGGIGGCGTGTWSQNGSGYIDVLFTTGEKFTLVFTGEEKFECGILEIYDGTQTPAPTVLYTYIDYDQGSRYKFYSDYTVNVEGPYSYSASWYEKEGYIVFYNHIIGENMRFTVNEKGGLELVAKCTHENSTVLDRTPATCVSEGHIYKKCIDCGEFIEEWIKPTGKHAYVSGICENCLCKEGEDGEVINRTFVYAFNEDSGLIFYEGGSVAYGEYDYEKGTIVWLDTEGRFYPNNDETIVWVVFDSLGETYAFVITENGASLIEEMDGNCANCGHVEMVLEALTAPTCTENGWARLKCGECGFGGKLPVSIDPRAHIDEDNDGVCDNCDYDNDYGEGEEGKCVEFVYYFDESQHRSIYFYDDETAEYFEDGESVDDMGYWYWDDTEEYIIWVDFKNMMMTYALAFDGSGSDTFSLVEGLECGHTDLVINSIQQPDCCFDGYIELNCNECGIGGKYLIRRNPSVHTFGDDGRCVRCGAWKVEEEEPDMPKEDVGEEIVPEDREIFLVVDGFDLYGSYYILFVDGTVEYTEVTVNEDGSYTYNYFFGNWYSSEEATAFRVELDNGVIRNITRNADGKFEIWTINY